MRRDARCPGRDSATLLGGYAWGPVYLLIRAPLQLAILFRVYWFTIRPHAAVAQGLR